jgi:hypothetical protein
MRVKIYFLLCVLLAALLPAAGCAGNGGTAPASVGSGGIPGNPEAAELEKTETPVLTDRTFLARDRYCIAGKGVEGAAVRIEGGVKPASGKITDGQFILEVFLEDQRTKDVTLEIYAKAEGMAESDPLTVTVGGRESREHKPIYIGGDNQIHYADTLDDFLGRALYGDDELAVIKNGAENLQQRLTDEGLNTKLIIFISPNPATIYPETMPDFLADQIVSNNSRLKQLTESFKNSPVKFINPYDRLIREKENNFLYNRTDTHWNELGAYFGYCEIFDFIGEAFPAAKPRPLDDFNVYRSVVRGGDKIPMLQFDQDEVTENAYVVRIKNPIITELARVNTDEISYQEQQYHAAQDYRQNNSSLPVILMYRDSFSISMMSPIAETSRRIIFGSLWDYNIDIDYVKRVAPDFIIIQRVERSLNEMPSIFWRFR